MSVVYETESKFELDASAFELLLHTAHVEQHTEQWNIYYDCADRLARHAATFRLRCVQGEKPILTFKFPKTVNNESRTNVEYEYPFLGPSVEAIRNDMYMSRDASRASHEPDKWRNINASAELPQDVSDALRTFGVRELERVGCVRNERYVVSVQHVGRLELDRLHLPDGHTVYEAEIEDPDLDVRQRIAVWIQEMAPAAKPSSTSKFQRFREAIFRMLEAELAVFAIGNANRIALGLPSYENQSSGTKS